MSRLVEPHYPADLNLRAEWIVAQRPERAQLGRFFVNADSPAALTEGDSRGEAGKAGAGDLGMWRLRGPGRSSALHRQASLVVSLAGGDRRYPDPTGGVRGPGQKASPVPMRISRGLVGAFSR